MNHIDEGRLMALLDDELAPEERSQVEQHVRECLPCRAELAELTSAAGTLTGALALADGVSPQGRGLAIGWPRATTRAHGSWSALPRAAVLVLGFAAAASATISGSPVRSWLADLARSDQAQLTEAPTARAEPAPEPAAAPAAVAEAGVSVLPLEGSVRIVLRDVSPDLRIRAVLSQGSSAWVYATGDAASARFQTAPGRIEVSGATLGELRIELPGSASSATVVVEGREYLRKDGERLQLTAGPQGRAATEVTFQPRP